MSLIARSRYNVTFTSPVNSTQARLSYYLGRVPSGTTVWISTATLLGIVVPRPVLRRDFECGVAIVNGDTLPHTVATGSGLKRLSGHQAPLYQYFVDDNSSAFQPGAESSWAWGDYNSGYTGRGEEVRPTDGYYHHWQRGAHSAVAGSSATFDLQIPAAGKYDLKMWWPAVVPARSGWSSAMSVTVGTGIDELVASVKVDLTKDGGDVWYPIAKSVQLAAGNATLMVHCPSTVSGTCIADAVLVESEARYNDGSPVAVGSGGGVTLNSMDAIILAWAKPPAHCGSGSNTV